MPQWTDRTASLFSRRPFLLFIALYAVLALIAIGADLLLPDTLHRAILSLTNGVGLGASDTGGFARAVPHSAEGAAPLAPMWAVGTIAMFSAGLLALPVAWLYTITRQKRGYNQSVVQSLILLPVVVAGVVVLVKFSLALAFSLAGIVAAVRFRNTLEDSKDAVYIFVVTGIGLASGVELSAAAALSIIFNFTTLLLFLSDFGRTPGRLEGDIAEERMQRALAVANRTSQFVARLDEEVLGGMAPEQLEAVANRAWQRRENVGGRKDGQLRVRVTDAEATRVMLDAVIEQQTKRWVFERLDRTAEGDEVLVYSVRLRKSVPPTALMDAIRVAGTPHVVDVELK